MCLVTTVSRGETSLRVIKTPPLCPLSLPPPVSVFGGPGSVCFAGLLVFLHLCAGCLLCCDCSVQVSWQKCDVAIMCPLGERRPAFSHTHFQAHLVKTAHTHESVDAQQGAWPCSTGNLPFAPVWFPEQAGRGRMSESCILSPVVFSCQGKWRIQTIVPKVKNAQFHYCLMKMNPGDVSTTQVKLNSAQKPKHADPFLKVHLFYVENLLFIHAALLSHFPFCLHLERRSFSCGVTLAVVIISFISQLSSSPFSSVVLLFSKLNQAQSEILFS